MIFGDHLFYEKNRKFNFLKIKIKRIYIICFIIIIIEIILIFLWILINFFSIDIFFQIFLWYFLSFIETKPNSNLKSTQTQNALDPKTLPYFYLIINLLSISHYILFLRITVYAWPPFHSIYVKPEKLIRNWIGPCFCVHLGRALSVHGDWPVLSACRSRTVSLHIKSSIAVDQAIHHPRCGRWTFSVFFVSQLGDFFGDWKLCFSWFLPQPKSGTTISWFLKNLNVC